MSSTPSARRAVRPWAWGLAWLAGALACGSGEEAGARAPEIVTEPADQAVREGEPATFTATFAAAPAPTLQWERADPSSTGWVVIAGATAAAYTTPPATSSDHGARYRVRATNPGGTSASSAAGLTVWWLHLNESPIDVTVAPGTDALFQAVFDANPPPGMQWEIRRPAGAWEAIAGATSPSYTFSAPALSDDGTRFRVAAENAFGVVQSAEATLTVISAPVITLEPSDQVVNEGGQATFAAGCIGLPAPALQWERAAPGTTTWVAIAGATASSYTTPAAGTGDLGARYRLVATNAYGTATSRAAGLTVRWLHLLASPIDFTVAAGTDATFQVAFDANPPAALQWQSAAPGGPWLDVAGATSSSYTFRAPVLADDGTRFRAIGANASGSLASAEATLTVVDGPRVVSFQAESTRLTAGDSTRLSYEFVGGSGAIDGVPVAGESGSVTVAPAATHTYTLTVTGPTRLVATAQATVGVYPVPLVASFRSVPAHVPLGTSTSLVAEFDAGPEGTAFVDQGIGAVQSGVATATGPITSATTFTLTVTNGAGRSTSAAATVALGIDVAPGESIQAAIDQATPGTTIYLAPGTYSASENAEAFLVFRPEKNGLVLRGTGASPGEVVLDGQNRVLHVVFFDAGLDASTRIENLTITRGRALPDEVFPGGFTPVLRPELLPDDDFYHDGAGIMLFDAAPTVDGVVVRENLAERCAGGISVFTREWAAFPAVGPVIRDSEFRDNQAGVAVPGIGGAIDVYGNTRATIVNDLFVGNTAGGGQVAVLGWSTATIRSSTFDGVGQAAGVLVHQYGTATVLDTIFVNQTTAPPVEVNSGGNATLSGNFYWNFQDSWEPPADSGTVADPLFASGPRGDYYLSQTAAGQAVTSPAVDAGSGPATDLPGLTTRTDGVPDEGVVDAGFHYAP